MVEDELCFGTLLLSTLWLDWWPLDESYRSIKQSLLTKKGFAMRILFLVLQQSFSNTVISNQMGYEPGS